MACGHLHAPTDPPHGGGCDPTGSPITRSCPLWGRVGSAKGPMAGHCPFMIETDEAQDMTCHELAPAVARTAAPGRWRRSPSPCPRPAGRCRPPNFSSASSASDTKKSAPPAAVPGEPESSATRDIASRAALSGGRQGPDCSGLGPQLGAQFMTAVLSRAFVIQAQPSIRQHDRRNVAQRAATERTGRRASLRHVP
jgi:hypothetical protein